MTRARIEAALRRRLERGEYVVDPRAVAEAMLASGVFVALRDRGPDRRARRGGRAPQPAATWPSQVSGAPAAAAARRLAPGARRHGDEQLVVVAAGGRKLARVAAHRRPPPPPPAPAAVGQLQPQLDAAALGHVRGVGGEAVAQVDHRAWRRPRPAPARRRGAAPGRRWRRTSCRPPARLAARASSPAAEPPSVPVTPTRSPGRAPSRPTSSSSVVGPAGHATRHHQRRGPDHVAAGERGARAPASSSIPSTSSRAPRSKPRGERQRHVGLARSAPIAARSERAVASAFQPTSAGECVARARNGRPPPRCRSRSPRAAVRAPRRRRRRSSGRSAHRALGRASSIAWIRIARPGLQLYCMLTAGRNRGVSRPHCSSGPATRRPASGSRAGQPAARLGAPVGPRLPHLRASSSSSSSGSGTSCRTSTGTSRPAGCRVGGRRCRRCTSSRARSGG